jgi:ABC-2 type transport system permease protein
LLLFLLIAVLGYLLFAALFVGIGATMSDISTAGNFQGLVIMLPFIPLFFIGPVSADPSGTLAQVLTYVPFTSPVILLLRLVLLDEWRWLEIVLSLAVLAASVWLFMKLAGKIFKIGILLYGKNATPKEIWKWIRA